MKKTIALFLACLTLSISGCYDDSAIWESIKEHEGRIKELELLCGKINENISSLQKIVQSLENKDYITSITPIKENGKDIGYTIKFSKSGDVTIYHGDTGATGGTGPAGHSPEIGAKADADGVYYWTIDGEWMRDEDGNLIPTTGKDGEKGEAGNSGVTPQLKIEDGYWFVSYNNGELWDKLSKATNDSAYCVFSDVEYTTTEVTFYLAEGESFSFPLVTSMTIKFEEKEYVVNNAEGESIEFVVEGAREDVDLEFMVDDEEWDISVAMTSSDKGVLTVVPATKKGSAKVMIFAQSGNQFDMCSLILKRTTVPIATIEEIGYNHFDVKICVPESVKESGNIIRYNWGDIYQYNDNIIMWGIEGILKYNGGEINTTDTDVFRTIKETVKYDYEREEYTTTIAPLVPGQPMVFLAAEFTPYGEMVGEPEIIRFKTKEPAVSNSKVNVTFDNVLSYDADIIFKPDSNIEYYNVMVLDEYTYENILKKLDNDETLMQWFITSYTGMYMYGIGMTSGASLVQLSSFFYYLEADSEYHVFVVGMENEKGTVQSYDHHTVKTAKKLRANGPSISVTYMPELSSSNSVAVKFKCTSVDNPNSGPAVTGQYVYEYVHNWLIANNSGWSDYELINGGIKFSGEDITRMNSSEGCIINIPTVDGMSLRIGAFAKNDEYTLCNTIPTIDVTTEYYKRTPVTSEYLTTDILEGEWLMTATDHNGKTLETTVRIIRGYQEGRDYPSGCPSEFREQVEIFNQKRLADKNCLLMEGWFRPNNEPYWWDATMTPYDLLMDAYYNAYDYEQLFFGAGPKMFIEVDSTGKLRINSGQEYLPASAWYEPAYYMGYSPNADIGKYNYIDFEINVSNDKKTLTINPTDGHYLNLVNSNNEHIDIRSAITLTRKYSTK